MKNVTNGIEALKMNGGVEPTTAGRVVNGRKCVPRSVLGTIFLNESYTPFEFAITHTHGQPFPDRSKHLHQRSFILFKNTVLHPRYKST